MDKLKILLMPDFTTTMKKMGIIDHDECVSDDIRYQQGYDMHLMEIKPGKRFVIDNQWESATIQCDGRQIRVIKMNEYEEEEIEEDNEHIDLSTGIYFFSNDGKTIEKIEDLEYQIFDEDEEMQNREEQGIYDMIKNSAKKRFDYPTFEKGINWPDSEIDIADKILWMIITHIANGEKPIIIAATIQFEMLAFGLDVDAKSIEEILKDNENNWKIEIETLKMATDMLNSNLATVEQVHGFVSRMLNG